MNNLTIKIRESKHEINSQNSGINVKNTHNAKKQTNRQTNKQIIMHDTYENMQQNAEMKSVRKLQHSFCDYRFKKNRNSTGEEPSKAKFECMLKTNAIKLANMHAKAK